jgi:hypothetical protein
MGCDVGSFAYLVDSENVGWRHCSINRHWILSEIWFAIQISDVFDDLYPVQSQCFPFTSGELFNLRQRP